MLLCICLSLYWLLQIVFYMPFNGPTCDFLCHSLIEHTNLYWLQWKKLTSITRWFLLLYFFLKLLNNFIFLFVTTRKSKYGHGTGWQQSRFARCKKGGSRGKYIIFAFNNVLLSFWLASIFPVVNRSICEDHNSFTRSWNSKNLKTIF